VTGLPRHTGLAPETTWLNWLYSGANIEIMPGGGTEVPGMFSITSEMSGEKMNLLLQELMDDSGLRQEARDWLHHEPRVNIKFLLNHNRLIWEAYDDEEMGPYLADGILPHVQTELMHRHWADAERSEHLPFDETWVQVVDLPEGISLLVPDEGDSTERILLFRRTSSDRLMVLTFDVLGDKISTCRTRRRYCLPAVDGSRCAGICPDGKPCRLRVYVGHGPARGFCEC
jgi:hypothetical protein